MKFRSRFSVRTLAIFVTLVCAYFGAWEATKRYGIPDEGHSQLSNIDPLIWDDWSPMPFVLSRKELDGPTIEEIALRKWNYVSKQRYYLWLFGPMVQLPLEHNCDEGPISPATQL